MSETGHSCREYIQEAQVTFDLNIINGDLDGEGLSPAESNNFILAGGITQIFDRVDAAHNLSDYYVHTLRLLDHKLWQSAFLFEGNVNWIVNGLDSQPDTPLLNVVANLCPGSYIQNRCLVDTLDRNAIQWSC